MSSLAPHEPKIVGSNPAPATLRKLICLLVLGFVLLACTACRPRGVNGDPVPQETWSTHVTCPPDCLPMAAGNPTKHA